MERIVRSVFVQRAEALLSRLRGRQRAASDVRIGLMIGVHRNLVRQIRSTKPRVQLQRVQRRHRGAALLQAWSTDWAYLTPSGLPRDLPIRAAEGEPNFETLVREHMPAVSTGTAIAELRRSGAIRLLPDEQVRFRSRSPRPAGLTEASIAAAAQHLQELAATLLHNLKSPEQQRPCEGIDPVVIDAQRLAMVRQIIARRTRNFLDTLAAELANEAPASPGAQGVQVGVTVFSHEPTTD